MLDTLRKCSPAQSGAEFVRRVYSRAKRTTMNHDTMCTMMVLLVQLLYATLSLDFYNHAVIAVEKSHHFGLV